MASATGKILSWSGAGVVLYASWLLILLTLPYLTFERTTDFLASKQLVYHLDWWRLSFYVHIFSSPVVILSGLFQFNRKLIHQYPKIHRTLGKIYIATVVFVSGPAALIMAFYANGNDLTKTSFVILSCLWLLFTWQGYRAARQRDFIRHGKLVLRSYALTLSAVTLRFYAYMMDITGVDMTPKDAYLLLSWISWIPNLLLAEVMIRYGYIRYLMKPVRQIGS